MGTENNDSCSQGDSVECEGYVGMREFRFKYRFWETFSYAVLANGRRGKKALLIMTVLPAGVSALGVLVELVSGKPFAEMDFGLSAWLLGFAAAVLALFFLQQLLLTRRLMAIGEKQIHIENGLITDGSENSVSYRCSQIAGVEPIGKMVILCLLHTKKEYMRLAIPRRLFPTQQELNAFVEFLKEQKVISKEDEGKETEDFPSGDWRFSFLTDEDLWLDLQIQCQDMKGMDLPPIKKRKIKNHSIAAGIFLGATAVLTGRSGKSGIEFISTLVIMTAIYALFCYTKSRPGSAETVRRQMRDGTLPVQGLGQWEVALCEDGIHVIQPVVSGTHAWEYFQYLLEVKDFYLFATKKLDIPVFLKKEWVAEGDRAAFIEYCQRHGVEYKRCDWEKLEKKRGEDRTSLYTALTVGVIVVAMAANVMENMMIKESQTVNLPQRQTQEETAPYVFHPEEFDHYLPLEKQAAVLKSLGIQVPPNVTEEINEWMEESPEAREWIEGEPFYSLLTELACPKWDEETWERISFSHDAYWFDFEGYDVMQDYMDILKGVNALSDGSFTITDPAADDSRVDWENGTGTLAISFKLNGKDCAYAAEVDNDWLDEGLITYLCGLLNEAGTPKQLYAIGDNGQGCILFYRDSTWAGEFTKKTGIVPEKY